tara:strand:+ start:8522 stop:8947 length:426 start_codon:yes stop_codon:yes gene_type:complete
MENKTEWKSGLPPVGEECEVLGHEVDNSEWEKCTIRFIGEFRVVYDSASCTERTAHISNVEFRPIKSQADLEREEFHNLAINCIFNNQTRKTLDALYDAGYRKQGEVVSFEDAAIELDTRSSSSTRAEYFNNHFIITIKAK